MARLRPDLGGDGADPLLRFAARVVGIACGGDDGQIGRDVLLGVVGSCGQA